MIYIFITYCFVGVYIIMQVIFVFTKGNLYQHLIFTSYLLYCVDFCESIPSLL